MAQWLAKLNKEVVGALCWCACCGLSNKSETNVVSSVLATAQPITWFIMTLLGMLYFYSGAIFFLLLLYKSGLLDKFNVTFCRYSSFILYKRVFQSTFFFIQLDQQFHFNLYIMHLSTDLFKLLLSVYDEYYG